jgi:hypothetical protein
MLLPLKDVAFVERDAEDEPPSCLEFPVPDDDDDRVSRSLKPLARSIPLEEGPPGMQQRWTVPPWWKSHIRVLWVSCFAFLHEKNLWFFPRHRSSP